MKTDSGWTRLPRSHFETICFSCKTQAPGAGPLLPERPEGRCGEVAAAQPQRGRTAAAGGPAADLAAALRAPAAGGGTPVLCPGV